ncbi:probable calcium-binding protein CML22 isoform X2 [Olea europaea var. sylvestris]|uniref:probable calcium-binding protein CML22 isoform X2 n=1 Tax=Olea europaea var. sylvestris TaxID=158386 RepID=UPI000C1D25D5|nr:probable calcium-binding protein CML22 isoform X2 [Olea europaea var. sylvestris]
MKDSQGTSELCPILKSFSNKVGVLFCCHSLPNIYKRLDTELERKMMEIKRNSLGNNRFRSIDSIILKFPQIRDGLKVIRGVFEKFDEDSNGTVDHEELKKCLQKLQFHVREEDIDDLFYYCDMNENEGIQFNEFIVLLCLIYLLKDCSSSFSTVYATIFLFSKEMDLDRNGKISFREFLFAFIKWVGIDSDDDDDDDDPEMQN